MGVGSEIGQICGVFSSKDSKNAHFLTFLNGYIHLTTSKTKNKPLGLCPNPTLTCEAAGAGGKPYPTPTVSVGSIQGVKGKMHDFVALDPLSISVGVAKLTEADGAGNLSRLAKQPRSSSRYGLEATTTLW